MKKILIPFAFILALFSLRAQPGVIDTTFKTNLETNGNNLVIKTVLIQPDNRIIIAGYYGSRSSPSSPGNTLVRLTADGAMDTTFNANSIPFYSCANNPYLYDVALQADGKILVGAAYNCNITRLDSNGTVDPTFNPLNLEYWGVFSFALQPDGKILVSNRDSVFRLNTDGSFDTTFNSASLIYSVDSDIVSYSQVSSITVQPDNKIIVAGSVYPNTNKGTIDSSAFYGVARLNANGTLDPTFNVSGQNYGSVNCVTLQPDGKILVGGDSLFRLNTDGTIDSSFNAQAILNPIFEILSIVIQRDGKVIIGGSFITSSGIKQSDLIRLNSDGSLDVTFNTGLSLAGVVSSLGLQSDGKIIVAGADSCLGCFPGPLVRLFGDSALLSVTILGRDTICSGDTTLMFADAISDNGPVTYSWTPAVGLSCPTCDSVYAHPDSTTTYTVIAQDSVSSDTAYLTVYVDPYTTPLIPTDSIYPLYNTVYLDTNRAFCLGPEGYFVVPIGFVVSSKNGGSHPQYKWLVDSTNLGISSDTFGINNLPCCGDTLFLACQMTSSLGCVRPLKVTSFTDTLYRGCNIEGISSPSIDEAVKIYPNPNNGNFLFSMDQPSHQLNIELYNIQGQRLYVEQMKDVPPVSKEFNFNNLAQGMYLMRITTENGTVVERVAVQ